MKNPRSAYVRRKQAKKECQGCGSSDVKATVYGSGVFFRCRSCNGSWMPGIRGFRTQKQLYREILG